MPIITVEERYRVVGVYAQAQRLRFACLELCRA